MPSSKPVILRVAPAGENLVLARTVAASMCAQLDFPIDQLDDLRLAVDEACALLIATSDGTDLEIEFAAGADSLEVTARAGTTATSATSPTSFAWLVISELCDEADSTLVPGRHTIRLRSRRRVEVT